MREFITNVILLLYLGIVLLYKLIGYSYFDAAWRALVWVVVLLAVALGIGYGYKWVMQEAERTENLENAQAETNENS